MDKRQHIVHIKEPEIKDDVRPLVKKLLERIVVDNWGATFLKDADTFSATMNAIYEGRQVEGVRTDLIYAVQRGLAKKHH